MAYYLPLRFLRVSSGRDSVSNNNDVIISATRVVAIMDYKLTTAKEAVKAAREEGNIINATGKKISKSVIFLDNGCIVVSPLTVRRLLVNIEMANHRPREDGEVAIPKCTNKINALETDIGTNEKKIINSMPEFCETNELNGEEMDMEVVGMEDDPVDVSPEEMQKFEESSEQFLYEEDVGEVEANDYITSSRIPSKRECPSGCR